MKRILDIIYAITHPCSWLSNYRSDQYWDKKLNSLLDAEFDIVIINSANVEIGGYKIWVENYPYGYGTSENDMRIKLLPYRRTRARLKKQVDKAMSDYVLNNSKGAK